MGAKKHKMKADSLDVNLFVSLFKNLTKMANNLYFTHPEYESKQEFITDYLRSEFPNYDWYLCSLDNRIKIHV